jgi:Na+-translocating ferredoxin:NAD+ oxidoreductase RNF subunit RnfB
MNTILITVLSLSVIGALAAVILFLVAQKFKVFEDPRIDDVETVLPGANCGGCGFPGCRGFAEACVKADQLDDLFCPVGGNTCMSDVAGVLGKTAVEKDPEVAVVRCSGSPEHRKRTNQYDGAQSCTIAHSLYSGDTGCQFGCLGLADCVTVCTFDAIFMNDEKGLPYVSDDDCTACGACVDACPRDIIELRKKNKKDRKIFVSCVSADKGVITKKACSVGCIGCKACVKACAYDAIIVENFLAYIDPIKCKLCRKCVAVCPTNSILEINFPPPKVRVEKSSEEVSSSEVVNN